MAFIGLPAELRLEVYRYVVDSGLSLHWLRRSPRVARGGPWRWSLLVVCRQVSAEFFEELVRRGCAGIAWRAEARPGCSLSQDVPVPPAVLESLRTLCVVLDIRTATEGVGEAARRARLIRVTEELVALLGSFQSLRCGTAVLRFPVSLSIEAREFCRERLESQVNLVLGWTEACVQVLEPDIEVLWRRDGRSWLCRWSGSEVTPEGYLDCMHGRHQIGVL